MKEFNSNFRLIFNSNFKLMGVCIFDMTDDSQFELCAKICKNVQKRCFIQILNTIMLLMKMNHCLVMLMMSLISFFLINAGKNASMKKTLMGVCILDKVDKVGGLSHFNQISHDYKRTISNSCQKAGASETISLKDIEIKGGLIQSHPKLF